jgi:branched-chain amino acid aminotransferase
MLSASAAATASEAPAAPTAPAPLQQWFDGEIASAERLHAPLTSHALHYGTGVFEGIRSYATAAGGGAVFRLDAHLQRMARGARALAMHFDADQASSAIIDTLRANRQRDAYVRPLQWYGEGGLGLDVAPLTSHLMVATLPWNSHLGGHRVRLTVSRLRRTPATSVPALKLCGNYINSILAKHDASERGFGEALFLDANQNVVECTGENVFLVKDGRVTAVAHDDALPGITRETVIELTGADVRPVTLAELHDADEVFLTGTSAEVAAIEALDDTVYGDNPVTRELQALYARLVRGEVAGFEHWLTRF